MMRTADSLSQVGAGCCVHVDSIYVMPAREGLYSGETMALFFFFQCFTGAKAKHGMASTPGANSLCVDMDLFISYVRHPALCRAHDRSAPFRMEKRKKKNNNRGGASNAGRGSPSVITDLGCLFCQRHFSQ